MTAAFLAEDGFTGARRILEGPQGMAAGMSTDADPARLTDGLGSRWALVETSFKFHASCRHTHPAADALLQVVSEHRLKPDDIEQVIAHVHQGAIDVLGPVTDPRSVHQSKFSMGTVLALIAAYGRAGMQDFEQHYSAADIAQFRAKVQMQLDPEVDRAYPQRWIGKVTVRTTDGRVLNGRVDEPKGDPGNTLTRSEIEEKAVRLAAFSGAASTDEMRAVCAGIWSISEAPVVGDLMSAPPPRLKG
jgi:2-methylcitrate dehydratase PrpD